MSDLLVLRADAGPGIGSGHATRMIALGEAWVAIGGDAILVSASLPVWMEREAEQRGLAVERITGDPGSHVDGSVSSAAATEAAWVVLDGYRFTVEFQRHFGRERLVVVDDHHSLGHYEATWIIDQNLGAEKMVADYRNAAPSAGLLLGPRYALLRGEFAALDHLGENARGAHVLISFGGAPPVGAQELRDAVVEGLRRRGLSIDVLTGSDHDVPARMARADVALSAAGSTAWELCAAGLAMVLVSIAHNQIPVARELHAAGAALDAGWYEDIDVRVVLDAVLRLVSDQAVRQGMSETARELVDGRGAHRVVRTLRGLRIRLREARQDDAAMLWEWANDPDTRAASFTPHPIPWESHVEWLRGRLADPGSVIYIAEDPEGVPVGQVRFDMVLEPCRHVEIDVSVDPTRRGRGYGASILRVGVPRAAARLSADDVEAVVKLSNRASINAFQQAGFELVGHEEVADHRVVRLRWTAS